VIALVALSLPLSVARAEDGPGGHLAGNFSAAWDGGGWHGQVAIELEPGTAARDAAVGKIKSGPHMRSGAAFSTEGAHVTGLTSVRDNSFDCGNGDGSSSRRVTTYNPVSDPDTPFFIDRPMLNLLKGTGTLHANPVRDNYGDPLPESGRDFFPVPGAVGVHTTFQPCPEHGDFPQDEDDTTPIFGTDAAVAVPFGVPMFMEDFDIPLRPMGSTWGAKGTVHDPSSIALDLAYDVKLVGPMSSWLALCQVPDLNVTRKAKTARSAVAMVKKAGWPKARYAGKKPLYGYPVGRYLVDPKFSSSGIAGCLVGRPRVYLVTKWHG
jgi:hypothetical protein